MMIMTYENSNDKCMTKEQLLKGKSIIRKLKKSGEYERLRCEMLADLLSLHPGWPECILDGLRSIIPEDGTEITLDELSVAVQRLGKIAPMPQETKAAMIQKICEAIQKCEIAT
jgi:hypothetical protein